jgi:hypothetical protein
MCHLFLASQFCVSASAWSAEGSHDAATTSTSLAERVQPRGDDDDDDDDGQADVHTRGRLLGVAERALRLVADVLVVDGPRFM